MGLGDYFMCNGLIRKLLKENESYTLFVKSKYINSVKQMYSDLKNFNILQANSIKEISHFLNINLKTQDGVLGIGYNMPNFGKPVTTEEWFYFQHNQYLDNKWNYFKSPRNHEREQKLFDLFNINEDYIFVHDDNIHNHPDHRGPKTIKNELLPSDIRIIRVEPTLTDNIFDYCLLIEKAKEVHCIESCFAYMTDLLNLNKFYIHEYPEPASKNDGIINCNKRLADWKNMIIKYQ
jgi:hypothetical protein